MTELANGVAPARRDHLGGLDGSSVVAENDAMSTVVAPSQALADRFHTLDGEWRAATQFLASPSAAPEQPTNRAVVALGPAAVPLILAELATAPEPRFAALRELTGAAPVPPCDRGRTLLPIPAIG